MLRINIRRGDVLYIGDIAVTLLDEGGRSGQFAALGIMAPREVPVDLKRKAQGPDGEDRHAQGRDGFR